MRVVLELAKYPIPFVQVGFDTTSSLKVVNCLVVFVPSFVERDETLLGLIFFFYRKMLTNYTMNNKMYALGDSYDVNK